VVAQAVVPQVAVPQAVVLQAAAPQAVVVPQVVVQAERRAGPERGHPTQARRARA
jgi:hypothetical protein